MVKAGGVLKRRQLHGRQGGARRSKAWQRRNGEAGRVKERMGMVRQAWRGTAGHGAAGYRQAGYRQAGMAWHGWA